MNLRIGLLPIMCMLHPFCIPSVLMMVLLCWGFEFHVGMCFDDLTNRDGVPCSEAVECKMYSAGLVSFCQKE